MHDHFHDLIQKGGPLMWPIIVFALAALTIVVERLLYFYFTGLKYPGFRERLTIKPLEPAGRKPEGLNMFGRLAEWVRKQQWERSPYVKLYRVYHDYLAREERAREEALKRAGSEAIEDMERYLRGLSAIAHVAPLLGLLGTVTGIISAFSVISSMGGQVDVSSLAAGIWEALITTVAGLSVAIPAQLAYIYFEKLVSERVSRMSYTVSLLNEIYAGAMKPDKTGRDEALPGPRFEHIAPVEEEAI